MKDKDRPRHDPRNLAELRAYARGCKSQHMTAADCASRKVEQWTNQAAKARQLGTPSAEVNGLLRAAFRVLETAIWDVYKKRVNISLDDGVKPS